MKIPNTVFTKLYRTYMFSRLCIYLANLFSRNGSRVCWCFTVSSYLPVRRFSYFLLEWTSTSFSRRHYRAANVYSLLQAFRWKSVFPRKKESPFFDIHSTKLKFFYAILTSKILSISIFTINPWSILDDYCSIIHLVRKLCFMRYFRFSDIFIKRIKGKRYDTS